MAEFDWMESPRRAPNGSEPARTREDEIASRAYLLARLGFPKKEAERKLKAKIDWEYERVGKAAVHKRLSALVTDAYRQAGVTDKKKRGG